MIIDFLKNRVVEYRGRRLLMSLQGQVVKSTINFDGKAPVVKSIRKKGNKIEAEVLLENGEIKFIQVLEKEKN